MPYIVSQSKAPVVISTLGITLRPGECRYLSRSKSQSAHVEGLRRSGAIAIVTDKPSAPAELTDRAVPEYSIPDAAALDQPAAPAAASAPPEPPVEPPALVVDEIVTPSEAPVDEDAHAALGLPDREEFLAMSREDREAALLLAGVIDESKASKDPSKSDLLKIYDAAVKG